MHGRYRMHSGLLQLFLEGISGILRRVAPQQVPRSLDLGPLMLVPQIHSKVVSLSDSCDPHICKHWDKSSVDILQNKRFTHLESFGSLDLTCVNVCLLPCGLLPKRDLLQ